MRSQTQSTVGISGSQGQTLLANPLTTSIKFSGFILAKCVVIYFGLLKNISLANTSKIQVNFQCFRVYTIGIRLAFDEVIKKSFPRPIITRFCHQ